MPQWHRVPLQIVLMGLIWLALLGLKKARMPGWSLIAGMAAVTVAFAIIRARWNLQAGIWVATFGVSTILLCGAAVVGWLAARGGRASDGTLATSLFAGYAIGQFLPFLF
ncbi:MAG: hypothetical protein DME25_17460 [Verrucomicrobia bacterium]|nr:MAG: hypothetical protein DME25_17460 [Verrucomicrobiota bacterium]